MVDFNPALLLLLHYLLLRLALDLMKKGPLCRVESAFEETDWSRGKGIGLPVEFQEEGGPCRDLK